MKKKLITFATLVMALVIGCIGLVGCTDKTFKGYDTDLAKEVGKILDIDVKFVKISWGAKETELSSKNIDLIWNGLTITDERKAAMEISTAYLRNNQVAVIRTADAAKYTNIETIKSTNAKIAAEDGSAGAEEMDKNFTSNTCSKVADMATAMIEVKAGTSDVAILDSVMANFYTKSDESDFKGKLQIIDNLIFAEEAYGIAARKGDVGTIDKINEALSTLYTNGKMKTIAESYGLAGELLDCTYTSKFDTLTTAEKSGWEYLKKRGKITIGYTLYAPIAYEA